MALMDLPPLYSIQTLWTDIESLFPPFNSRPSSLPMLPALSMAFLSPVCPHVSPSHYIIDFRIPVNCI